jgi:cyclopropane fatty-acyl-phospholipid synthase-like methyltransferase
MVQLAHLDSDEARFGEQFSEKPASQHSERGRTNGLPFIFWLLEQRLLTLLAIPTTAALVVTLSVMGLLGHGWNWIVFGGIWLLVPLLLVFAPLMYLVWRSHGHDAGAANWEPYFTWKDSADTDRWRGQKIPMAIVYDAYLAGKLDFKGDLHETLLSRNQLFRFCFTWIDVKFYFLEFLRQNLTHSQRTDKGDIAHVYNRGNDFYHWFLGDMMVYTTGVFQDPSETLEQAQERKLDTVCRYVQMQPGDQHLDIGCGWGSLVNFSAKKYGSYSTGITLAQEQVEWARERATELGVSDRVHLIVDDYRNLPSKKWDKITCLEMAEHVGIRNFQKFLLQVKNMLKDDGIFYLQIAGFRRPWEYEDFVWGIFMGKYVFPGADASCPLGFVASQCERAGFEVHRVENSGVHYGLTIHKWYENWKRNQAAITSKYGETWFRKWLMFLAWSPLIAWQGSSALFMLTLTKNTKNDKSSVAPDEARNVPFSRLNRWVGKNTIATQQ